MKTLPKIELKNVQVNQHLSEETFCYSATVYLDGRRFCEASNRGYGGADDYHALRPKGGYWKDPKDCARAEGIVHKRIDEIDALLKEQHGTESIGKHDGKDIEFPKYTFEHVVTGLVAEFLQRRDLKRLLSRKLVWRMPGKGIDLREGRKPKPFDVEIAKDSLAKVYPGATLLNALPEDEALKIWNDFCEAA